MKSSAHRILTTHAGSLPRPPEILQGLADKDAGRPFERAQLDQGIRQSTADVVKRQTDIGMDIVNDGEHSKSSFASYCRARLSGIEHSSKPPAFRGPTRDTLAFAAVYEELARMNAARGVNAPRRTGRMGSTVCTGPITYIGQEAVAADIANLQTALKGRDVEDGFITAISPTNLEMYHANEYYRTDEEYLEALANAMNVEYRAIVDAGFILQIDDPRLATHYNRIPGASIEECRKFMALRIEAVNHALRGIPREIVRFHTCYSVNIAPRVHDWELKHYIDLERLAPNLDHIPRA